MSHTIVAPVGHFAAARRQPLNGPMKPIAEDLNGLLEGWQQGNPQSQERLLEAVWGELHHLARIYLSNERRNHTLQPTALVNEAYLRLAGQKRISWQNIEPSSLVLPLRPCGVSWSTTRAANGPTSGAVTR